MGDGTDNHCDDDRDEGRENGTDNSYSASDGGSRDGRDEDVRFPDVAIDEADRQLLLLIGSGRSTVEAGRVLGMPLAVVTVRLRVVRQQLGVDSTAAAVAKIAGSPGH